jgi:hypothetical protein
MDASEASRMRADILADVGALLDEHLAGGEWGRLLVEVVRGADGAPIVAGVDVEEIIGDEARVDAAFGGEGVRGLLPVLARASEALCGLDGVELDEVRGGTFVRRPSGGFAWLPGLVRTPSASFDGQRDAAVAAVREKNGSLGIPFGAPVSGGLEVDLLGGSAAVETKQGTVRARPTLLGTFATAARTWAWGAYSPHAPEAVKRASSALTDGLADRSMWEVSTPVFASDVGTAWAIAAVVCQGVGGDAVCCGAEEGGLVFLLLRDVKAQG